MDVGRLAEPRISRVLLCSILYTFVFASILAYYARVWFFDLAIKAKEMVTSMYYSREDQKNTYYKSKVFGTV